MNAALRDAQTLTYTPIDDEEARTMVHETQQLADSLSPTIGADLRGYVKDIGAHPDHSGSTSWESWKTEQELRVCLAAANAALMICAERIAQDALLTQLSVSTLN